MSLPERIFESVKAMPERLQAEVFDFVEYLAARAAKLKPAAEHRDWSALSLSSAMRGMESEETGYSLGDLKESFHD